MGAGQADTGAGQADKVAGRAYTVSRRADAVAGQADAVSDRAHTIAGQADTVADRVDKVTDQVDTLFSRIDTVAERAGAVAERVSPANCTPSKAQATAMDLANRNKKPPCDFFRNTCNNRRACRRKRQNIILRLFVKNNYQNAKMKIAQTFELLGGFNMEVQRSLLGLRILHLVNTSQGIF